MTDETLEERCDDCDSELIRTSADDPVNPHNCPVVTCPGCLDVVRRERQ
ncbi:hypothetical protein [Natrarchaeobius oligotrophus]|nr:hypothetical protein [Natrarchaeobius chitinivorans]